MKVFDDLVKMRKFDEQTNFKLYTLLGMGVMCIAFAILQLPTIWAFKSSLMPIQGTLRSANVYIKAVTDRKGHTSQVSELIFFLNESDKKFHIAENIGDSYVNENYNRILRSLNRSKSITIWIKKNEISDRSPKVFQIDQDDKHTLLKFEKVKDEKRALTAFLFAIGLLAIAFFTWMKYPDKVKKIFSD